jgi:hypothetical protein
MIRYDLRCAEGHAFEAWFRDSAAYDAQRAEGAVTFALCGSAKVEKRLMAPALGAATRRDAEAPASTAALSAPPDTEAGRALAALRAHVEKTAEHVGPRFASEARRIHLGEADKRAIWGEATAQDVRALAEDGVPVAPLPFIRKRDD